MRFRSLPFAAGVWFLTGCHSNETAMPSAGPTTVSVASNAPSRLGATIPGPKTDGSVLLPNQWSLRPEGKQIQVGDFPSNIALHPEGKYAAVLHCGYGQHEVVILDLVAQSVKSRIALAESFYGLAFSRDGARLMASGASKETLHVMEFKHGFVTELREVALRDPKLKGIPSGVAISKDGRTAWVASVLGQRISVVDLVAGKVSQEIQLAEGELAKALREEDAPKSDDEDSITKRAEALLQLANADAPYPYAVVVDEARGRLYVSLWAQSAVQVLDLASGSKLERWQTGDHPNEMILTKSGKHLLVANANHNTVSVIDTATGKAVEQLVAALMPDAPPGSTPNSLALSPDEKHLYVANANINAVAVFDVETWGKSRSLGFIPVGWYPTSVRVTSDGKQLLVANGKGLASKSNRNGPQPGVIFPGTVSEYIAGLFQGTVSIIALPSTKDREATLKKWSAKAYAGMPVTSRSQSAPLEPGHPIPSKIGDPSPIRYVVYIIKENRTYDQILGDLPMGNGDPTLCLFPEKITPNHHQLAREFVLLDNFYVESEVSADGHEWSMGAYATDFVEKTWPLSYGHNQLKKYSYPSEGNFSIATPAGGYLWDRAREAGVTYRSYGEFVTNAKAPDQPGKTRVKALEGHFDPLFRSFDMDYSDQKRADRFLSELKRFESEGEMPRLQIVRLPNDHTSGTSVGKATPTACVADNDLAFGRVIEGISRSKFWPKTAVFVVEDDAQNGPDHVDAHRTIAYVISPYVKRRTVDSTMYSTASMLRTMELILGLRPMSQFDALAQPMAACFGATPDLTPYRHLRPEANLDEKNTKLAWGSKLSDRMDFTKEDAADDLLLNQVVWRSVRGADSPMPAPVRAGFVLAEKGDEEEED
jgi:YVTN family beta-propeller protein